LAVTQILEAERSLYPRLIDACEALTWRLARRPDSDAYLIDEKHWVYKQVGSKKHIDNFQVTILHIQVVVP
jgi:hypothetical protein